MEAAQEAPDQAPLSAHNLEIWMREKLAQGRSEDVVTSVVELFRQMNNQHLDRLREAWKRRAREVFGRKSEQISEDQLDLLFELFREREQEASTPELSGAAALLDEAQPPGDKPSEKSQKRRRRAPPAVSFPPELPRIVVPVSVPEAERCCPSCKQERGVIGFEESEQLEYTPAQFHVNQIQREKRACAKCRDAVVRAPAPPRVVERGKLGSGLVAQILVAKYGEHVPLYRQREIYKRSRVDLSRSTLGDAVAAACFVLRPIAQRIREKVLASDLVSTDDTGLRVLDPSHPKGSKRGFLWPYVSGRFAYFAYTESRASVGPMAELGNFRGYVQVDGYSGYDALWRGDDCPRIEVGCFMHARRYFVQAIETGDLRALPVVAQLQLLYAIEREAKEKNLDAEGRRALREENSRPLLDELHAWLEAMAPQALPKSPLGKAIHYTLKRWPALPRPLEDGRLEIDNGLVERLIRIVALGRKNFLFAGSDAGAERAATAYTVLATCRLHELDPWAYVKDVLEKIAGDWPQRDLDRLLPDAWAAEHPAALRRSLPA